MQRNKTWSIFVVDLIGGAFLLACLGGTAWFSVLRNEDTSGELVRLRRQIVVVRQALAALRAERDHERLELRDRERQLRESGALPSRVPVEQYFQTLATLAARFRLQVLRQNPLPHRTYPGLLERRYTYEVSGSMPDIERFLRALERTEFWADVAFLKITGSSAAGNPADSRVASLTISVFSAVSSTDESGQG